VTNCQDGRSIDGLSELRIEQTSSDEPPAGGVQSSQPTLPSAVEHSGILRTTFHVQGTPVSVG